MATMLTNPVDIETTFGACLLGTLFSSVLSGIAITQVIIYFILYKDDPRWLKCLVILVFILDTTCTSFMWAGVWEFLINHFGERDYADHIPWEISLIMLFSSLLTCSVHSFFAHRIYRLSKGNWFIVGPIILLELLRLSVASVITTKFIQLERLSIFQQKHNWVFTFGLVVLVVTEFLVTGSLVTYLHRSRTELHHSPINRVITNLIHTAFETGLITCIGALVSLICWIVMPGNMVFLGIFFTISQLYATTFLSNLNSRHSLRRGHSASVLGSNDTPIAIKFRGRQPSSYPPAFTPSSSQEQLPQIPLTSKIRVDVDRYVAVDRNSRASLSPGRCISPAVSKRDNSRDSGDSSPSPMRVPSSPLAQ